jgi:anti-sigma B factor antagonist
MGASFPARRALGFAGVSRLSVATSIEGRAAVIALAGELDLAGAAELERELERLESSPPAALVLDLRGVEFMDSSGLRVIVLSGRRAEEHGRRFALVPGAAQVMRVFDLTRMRERLDFVASPEEVTGAP